MLCSSIDENLSCEDVKSFCRDGFLIHQTSILAEEKDTDRLVQRLENVINGHYDLGSPPHKVNKIPQYYFTSGVFSFSQGEPKCAVPQKSATSSTIHIINISQSDSLFRQLVRSPSIGRAVMMLMGWERYGCRLAQDQVWIKPPNSGALSFHRDTPYIDFSPKEVCTVWIPFDDVSVSNIGTLEYCVGSHLWSSGRRGSANQFYMKNYRGLLESAAQQEIDNCGKEAPQTALELCFRGVIGTRGCCSFHNGNTWHGSGPNQTSQWRRGIGIHYVRGDAVLDENHGKLWSSLTCSAPTEAVYNDVFPLVVGPAILGTK